MTHIAAHEIAQIRQTVAMLQPGADTRLPREDVLRMVAEITRLQRDLVRLTTGLRNLLDGTAVEGTPPVGGAQRASTAPPSMRRSAPVTGQAASDTT